MTHQPTTPPSAPELTNEQRGLAMSMRLAVTVQLACEFLAAHDAKVIAEATRLLQEETTHLREVLRGANGLHEYLRIQLAASREECRVLREALSPFDYAYSQLRVVDLASARRCIGTFHLETAHAALTSAPPPSATPAASAGTAVTGGVIVTGTRSNKGTQ